MRKNHEIEEVAVAGAGYRGMPRPLVDLKQRADLVGDMIDHGISAVWSAQ
jgi:hypothetical protein